ncbi:MAG TPA: hypothetical protein VLR27_08870 [Acidimicrobiales bacterium]|nr:hypothetical protein [Acidimicrobiales bacterium]
MRLLILCFAALALLAGACGDDDDSATGTTTTLGDVTSTTADATSTSTTTSTSVPSSTTTEDEGTASLEQTCESPDGFTISYPGDWDAVSDCGQFGPAPLDEPAPATDERTGVVSAFVDPVPFEQVAEPAEGDDAREETTIDDLPAVRVEGEQEAEGLYPEGTSYVRWMVDLSEVRGDATLFLDAYDLGYDIDFGQAVQVLDDMVETVEVTDG